MKFIHLHVKSKKKNNTIDNYEMTIATESITHIVRRNFTCDNHYTEVYIVGRENPLIIVETPKEIIEMIRGVEKA